MKADADARLTRVRGAAAVFVGLVALSYGDLSGVIMTNSPRVLRALFVTATVFCGFTVVRAYVALETAARQLEDDSAASAPGRNDVSGRRANVPADEYYLGRAYYRACLWLGILATGLFLLNVWIPAIR